MTRLVLFVRYPTPGEAKTRLIPALGDEGAAAVHRLLTERTISVLRGFGEVEVRTTGAEAARFRDWLGDDLRYRPQVDGDLGDRLRDAIDPAPFLFFGADTPDLAPGHVEKALAALAIHGGVVGPAEDGGYWVIGMNHVHPELFDDMPWSTDALIGATLDKAAALRLNFALLDTLADCDRPEDLARWPWLTP